MWVFLNNSFLSIVQKPGDEDELTVRARVKGDIEAVFPSADVKVDAGSDYKYRARVPRAAVAEALSASVMNLSYTNFKSSVEDSDRHAAYLHVWEAMNRLQEKRS